MIKSQNYQKKLQPKTVVGTNVSFQISDKVSLNFDLSHNVQKNFQQIRIGVMVKF